MSGRSSSCARPRSWTSKTKIIEYLNTLHAIGMQGISACRKSLFTPLTKFLKHGKVSKTIDFNGDGHPSWVSLTHPSLPLSQIYHFIDGLEYFACHRHAGYFSGRKPLLLRERERMRQSFFAGYVDIGAHLCGGTRGWGDGSVLGRYACGFPEKTGGFGAGERYQLVGRSRKEHLTAPVSCARADVNDPVRLRWACPPVKTASAAAARCPRRCLRWSGRWHRWAFDPPPRRG